MAACSMHIRFLVGSLDVTEEGSAYDARLIRALSDRGHQISVVSRTRSEPDGPIRIYGVPSRGGSGRLAGPFRLPVALGRGARQVRRLPLDRPDVTIGTHHDFLRGHFRRFPDRPWVYLPHGYSYADDVEASCRSRRERRIAVRTATWLQRWAVAHAATTVRFSRNGIEGLKSRLDIEEEGRFALIPPATWIGGGGHHRPAGAPLRVLVVGPLVPHKQVDMVVDALASAQGGDWVCDVVGEGPLREALQAETRARGLPVRFHGTVADLGPFYREADVLAFPSRLEHVGQPVLEAMMHGVPVLALDSRAADVHTAGRELIDDGETGWLARSDDEFAGGLHRLAADPAIAQALRARTLEVARGRFDFDRHLDRWEALLKEVVASAL
jgi:glycosyltransferase involved in cell wall biosynthesis